MANQTVNKFTIIFSYNHVNILTPYTSVQKKFMRTCQKFYQFFSSTFRYLLIQLHLYIYIYCNHFARKITKLWSFYQRYWGWKPSPMNVLLLSIFKNYNHTFNLNPNSCIAENPIWTVSGNRSLGKRATNPFCTQNLNFEMPCLNAKCETGIQQGHIQWKQWTMMQTLYNSLQML